MIGNIPYITPPRNTVMEGGNDKIRVFESEAPKFNNDGSITTAYNLISEFEGFYVSFNPYDPDYGCSTTALVLGQMQRFYILKGNHNQQYKKLIPNGFKACLDYFVGSSERLDKFSDKVPNVLN